MALNAKSFLALEPGMIVEISPLAGVTTAAGQGLTGPRIEDIFTDGMGENPVPFMTLTADFIDRPLEHRRVVRTMGGMAIVAGIGHRMFVFFFLVALKGGRVALPAGVPFLPFQQPLIITGVRRMAGHAAIFLIANQVVVGGRHLLTDLGMAKQAGIDRHRGIFPGMTIGATLGVRLMQNVPDQARPIAAMRIVTGPAVFQISGEIGMFPLHR